MQQQATVGIKVLDKWEIGTAGRKGWMDRVEWLASRRSASRGRGCHHRKVKMFGLGCAWDSVPYAERRMAVGKSWLAGCDDDDDDAALAGCWLAAGGGKPKRLTMMIVAGYLHKGRRRRVCRNARSLARKRVDDGWESRALSCLARATWEVQGCGWACLGVSARRSDHSKCTRLDAPMIDVWPQGYWHWHAAIKLSSHFFVHADHQVRHWEPRRANHRITSIHCTSPLPSRSPRHHVRLASS